MMHAGRLRQRVTWFKPVRTRKEGGQSVPAYELVRATFACVEPAAAGGESQAHDQVVAIRSHVVTIRDDTVPVEADWLCVWNGVNLNAVKVDRERGDANTRWLVVSCLELAPATD